MLLLLLMIFVEGKEKKSIAVSGWDIRLLRYSDGVGVLFVCLICESVSD